MNESSLRKSVCLTVDHEIFGNGSGNVRRHIIEPIERMAQICEKFRMPLTVFVKVEEYLAFEREREALKMAWGFDPADELRVQAIDLVRCGHEVQLHPHPEWVGSRYEDGCWMLRATEDTKYRFQTLGI